MVLAGVLVALAAPAAVGADPAPGLRRQAADLRQRDASLAERSSAALLSLYSLDSRLDRARAELASLQARVAALQRERAQERARLAVARRTLAASERQLAAHLRLLYEQGDTDPLSILLGATSLDEALTELDDLSRSAKQNRAVVTQARAARKEHLARARSLLERETELERLEAAAAATATSLSQARAERARYVAQLAAERRLNAAQIVSLEARARAIEASAEAISTQQSAAGSIASFGATVSGMSSAPGSPSGSGSLTVTATGYALPGTTATGIPVGPGVVAVDPAVIPLGTRMTIPGYGEGVAADVGSAVRGATIDLWFPTVEQAFAWGRRTVTITLH